MADIGELALIIPVAPQFQFLASRQFASWMAEQRVSIGFTTYQAGLLFLIGLQENGRFCFFNRSLPALHGDCGPTARRCG